MVVKTTQAYEKQKYRHGLTKYFLNMRTKMSTWDIPNFFNL
jgi:hypothetical protein